MSTGGVSLPAYLLSGANTSYEVFATPIANAVVAALVVGEDRICLPIQHNIKIKKLGYNALGSEDDIIQTVPK